MGPVTVRLTVAWHGPDFCRVIGLAMGCRQVAVAYLGVIWCWRQCWRWYVTDCNCGGGDNDDCNLLRPAHPCAVSRSGGHASNMSSEPADEQPVEAAVGAWYLVSCGCMVVSCGCLVHGGTMHLQQPILSPLGVWYRIIGIVCLPHAFGCDSALFLRYATVQPVDGINELLQSRCSKHAQSDWMLCRYQADAALHMPPPEFSPGCSAVVEHAFAYPRKSLSNLSWSGEFEKPISMLQLSWMGVLHNQWVPGDGIRLERQAQ
jgi:hypothetical protein